MANTFTSAAPGSVTPSASFSHRNVTPFQSFGPLPAVARKAKTPAPFVPSSANPTSSFAAAGATWSAAFAESVACDQPSAPALRNLAKTHAASQLSRFSVPLPPCACSGTCHAARQE